MARFAAQTIGSVIHPSWSYDLESSLRIHRMLMLRAKSPKWRFKGTWVVTGPLESLCGYPGCGSGFGDTSWCSLELLVDSGLEQMTRRVNDLIFRAMCDYPGFASLNEELPNRSFVHCEEAIQSLRVFEGGRTLKPLNSCHKRARSVRNVRIVSHESRITLDADVTLSGSSWGLFWLNKSQAPKWNDRMSLAKFLNQARISLEQLVASPNTQTETLE